MGPVLIIEDCAKAARSKEAAKQSSTGKSALVPGPGFLYAALPTCICVCMCVCLRCSPLLPKMICRDAHAVVQKKFFIGASVVGIAGAIVSAFTLR